MKVLVLGCGLIGRTIAQDLAKRHDVTVADNTESALDSVPDLETILFDISAKDYLKRTVKNFDLVICAVPGFLGFETLKSIIEAGVNVVDISFFPEDALSLNDLAVKNGVTAVVDMGIAPGLDNLILGHHDSLMKVDSFECLVGGLMKEKYTYKAPFSPADVIQEYIRPARMFENGKVVTKRALSDPQHVVMKDTVLQAFNTDGLRSLLTTMKHIPNMREKTLRYPGHREQMIFLRDSGFFTKENLESTSKVLFDSWKLTPEDDEFTFMRVTIKGGTDRHVWEIYDETDLVTRTSSMARTTGYTCCAIAEAVLSDNEFGSGILPGELIGGNQRIFSHVISFLEERGVKVRKC